MIYYNITRIDKAENRSIEEWQPTSGMRDARGPRRARAASSTGAAMTRRGLAGGAEVGGKSESLDPQQLTHNSQQATPARLRQPRKSSHPPHPLFRDRYPGHHSYDGPQRLQPTRLGVTLPEGWPGDRWNREVDRR